MLEPIWQAIPVTIRRCLSAPQKPSRFFTVTIFALVFLAPSRPSPPCSSPSVYLFSAPPYRMLLCVRDEWHRSLRVFAPNGPRLRKAMGLWMRKMTSVKYEEPTYKIFPKHTYFPAIYSRFSRKKLKKTSSGGVTMRYMTGNKGVQAMFGVGSYDMLAVMCRAILNWYS